MKESDSAKQVTLNLKFAPFLKKRWKPWTALISFIGMMPFYNLASAGFACLSNPCINGICIDDINSTYSCYCIDGFTGLQCQTNWDECWSSPCQNGGTCIDGIAEYNCTCADGYLGSDCEINFNECDSNPCQNNATCLDDANGYICSCLPGYSGIFCEMDMAVCNSTEETRCLNGGVCLEDIGMAFSCKCTAGWGGKLCDIQKNECSSSPCQNGGICIDQYGGYSCACTYGYTGKNCDVEIERCNNSTCTNNALCMMEDKIKRCYCVPDYHGEKCQFQYDECLLGPRCMNGGTCIDGVDNFTCSCPSRLTGVLCECLILENDELDCSYVSPSPLTTESTEFITSFVYSTTISNIIPSTTLTHTEVESKTVSDVSTDGYGESTFQTNVPITLWDQITSTVFDDTSITTRESYNITMTLPPTEKEMLTSESIPIQTEKYDGDNITSTSSNVLITKEYTLEYSTFSTFDEKETSIEDRFTSLRSITTELKTDFPKTTEITEMSTTGNDSFVDVKTDFPFSATMYQSTTDVTDTETFTNIKNAPDFTSTNDYDHISPITSTEILLTDISDKTTTELITTTESTTVILNEISTVFELTDLPFTISDVYNLTLIPTTEQNDCGKIMCLNGGTCIISTEGPKCVCKFDFDGPYCEDMVGIATAAFSGDSYLTHKLYNMTGMKIQVRVRTLSTEGLILYANIGLDIYMYLYMIKGHLKFKFSCGYQTMLLSELDMPINNGYELKIKTILKLNYDQYHCNASLHINDTLAMSGGQIMTHSSKIFTQNSWLHLGAIPEGFDSNNHVPLNVASFTGCMFGLRIDEKPRHIFKDASDGFEIKECSSLACLSNPCFNGGSCNEIGEQWICNCANGYLGKKCEDSVCRTNPCQFGGTCVEHPGSGFICLCPLSKHGLYCEHNLEIAQPSFSPMVGGLSSFAIYQLSSNLVKHGMEIQFRIQPSNMDQISLLAFLGQSGSHDPKSDHLAVTFVKGYIMLTWNLGNGPRRIFTSRPISLRSTKPHTIKVGRLGRTAWLAVDNMQNITGNAPGNLLTLDVLPLLYIGGHDSANFSLLPHDLPLHGGFSGCIWDLWVGSIGTKSSGSVSWNPIRGRAVGQCSVTQCHPMICHNSGACLHHSATYSCLCPQGWFGPLCTSQQNPCDITNNKCVKGSTCVPTVTGYQCDCPLGKTGVFCEKHVNFSDVSLSGIRSYIKLHPVSIGEVHFTLEFEVRPLHPKGLLFYMDMHDGCFISLSLQGGILEYRWVANEWGGKNSGFQKTIIVRSGVVFSLGSWHSVRAGRYGRKIFLWIDGTMTSENFESHQFFTTFNTTIYIGGIQDLSTLPPDATSGNSMSFTGCIRKVIINSKPFPLNEENIIESRNVDDCDGDICGGDVCWNGGTCIIVREKGVNEAICACQPPYTGSQCMQTLPCKITGCNKGRCIQGSCVCPMGWEGHYCQNQIKIDIPQFNGKSHMIIDRKEMDKFTKYNKIRYKRTVNYIHINFTTASTDGLLLWCNMNDKKHISVGLEGGYLKVSWTLNKIAQNSFRNNTQLSQLNWSDESNDIEVIKLLQAGKISNGAWHSLHFTFSSGNVSIRTDNKLVYEENGFYYETDNYNAVTFLGGLPYNISIPQYTKGIYFSNFIGCISEVSLGEEKYFTRNFSLFESENIEMCQLFL